MPHTLGRIAIFESLGFGDREGFHVYIGGELVGELEPADEHGGIENGLPLFFFRPATQPEPIDLLNPQSTDVQLVSRISDVNAAGWVYPSHIEGLYTTRASTNALHREIGLLRSLYVQLLTLLLRLGSSV